MSPKKDKARYLDAAEKYIKAGKYQDAINEYERLMDGEPLDPNIANVIGDLYLRIGQEGRAVKTYQEIAASYEAKGLYSQSLAVYKKINKAIPEDIPSAIKLADLYAQLGFAAEAKAVYSQVAERLEKERYLKGLIFVYEKLIKLDRTDPRYRLKLADLYAKDGSFDEAVEELNEAAEILIESGDTAEAEKLLGEARVMKKGHIRTVLNLVNILKKRDKIKDAIALMEEALAIHRDSPELLSRLGGLYIDADNLRMGEEIFSRLYAKYPNDINIRVKLGYTLIQQNKVETAFQLYEPLINTLLSKGKEDKAIGLLGLVFSAAEIYVPALEKLAVIYKSKDQKKSLELALRVLLQEYRRKGLRDRMLVVLRELVSLCPEDRALAKEYATAGTTPSPAQTRSGTMSGTRSAGLSATSSGSLSATKSDARRDTRGGFAKLSEQDQEMIRINLNKADLYLQQGLIRNARRILENLLLLYPDEPRITQKIALLKEARTHTDAEAIPDLVEKAVTIEQGLGGKGARAERGHPEPMREKPEPVPPAPEAKGGPVPDDTAAKIAALNAVPNLKPSAPRPAVSQGPSLSDKERVTAAELFSTINIVLPMTALPKFKYHDLQERIAEEQALMQAVYFQQFKKETTVVEKELADIITEFRAKMAEKVDKDNSELHFNLGVAFLEQGLHGEARQEFEQAARDPSRAVECYTMLSNCCRRTKDFKGAKEWLEKALSEADPGSTSCFAVKYEWALLLEELNEVQKALPYYLEVKSWNSGFRDVARKVRSLKKASA
jgi:tetratricopeptide (TPR) repeat protein